MADSFNSVMSVVCLGGFTSADAVVHVVAQHACTLTRSCGTKFGVLHNIWLIVGQSPLQQLGGIVPPSLQVYK